MAFKKDSILKCLVMVTLAVIISNSPLSARDFVHIFTSKGVYETCEDLWFKCLFLNDSTFRLSDSPHTAYVEILNPSDSVVWKEKYPVVDGECYGQIYVGDDWVTGEYRMYVNTASSIGLNDSTLTPKKLLIVRELPEAQAYLSDTSMAFEELVDSIPFGKIKPLIISMELDSTEYHIRSKVSLKIKVTDDNGVPIRASLTLSVFDHLYNYKPGDLDLLSQCVAIQNLPERNFLGFEDVILADGPVVGYLKSQKKKNKLPLGNQYINVFDYSESIGNLNLVGTEDDGRFEIPMDMAASLGWDILMKPVSGKEMKPLLEFTDPFDAISGVRKKAKDRFYPVIRKKYDEIPEDDTLDYKGRRTVRLDEIIVKGHAGKYPKRNKFLGYLDSISTLTGGAWICGCPAGGNTTFLNDFIPGYTHHPNGYGRPVKRGVPVKGKDYELIKYSGGTNDDWVEDIRHIIYPGPKYSEEELLRMNGLWKTKGYYPSHQFTMIDKDDILLGLEDNRNTLLWIPKGETDANGELVVEFFTSDIKSRFIIRGFAIDSDDSSISVGVIDNKFVEVPL